MHQCLSETSYPLLKSYTYLLISLHSPNPLRRVIVIDLQPFLSYTHVSYVSQIIDSMTILCPCRRAIVWRALSLYIHAEFIALAGPSQKTRVLIWIIYSAAFFQGPSKIHVEKVFNNAVSYSYYCAFLL